MLLDQYKSQNKHILRLVGLIRKSSYNQAPFCYYITLASLLLPLFGAMSRLLIFSALTTFFATVCLGATGDLPVNQACLGCICEAISGCDLNQKCSGDICGPFQMTWPYWADGGKPTINKESPDKPGAYANCANDPYCAALAIQGYMSKYQQDCNGDGKIDCDDFAAIHKIGGYGCRGATIPEPYYSRYQQCKKIVGGTVQG